MSILFENDEGFYISHNLYIEEMFKNVPDYKVNVNKHLFKISSPYKSPKTATDKEKIPTENLDSEVLLVKRKFLAFRDKLNNLLPSESLNVPNTQAIKAAENIYKESGCNSVENALGANNGGAAVKRISQSSYLFPENCRFFCKDVVDMEEHLQGEKYDFILMDPPWWNKYIRRKRKKSPHAYSMMFNEDLKTLPIEKLLNDQGLVAVWCTNSSQHLTALINDIFPKWEVEFTSKWFWVKVTESCKPVCEFSKPNGKQPFEQIVFAHKKRQFIAVPPKNKLLVSVPSAIHSHKPPLVEVLKEFLPENPKCLEIFARYLQPHWTSYGKEAIRLNHESLFDIIGEKEF